VVLLLHRLFPDAPIYTSLYDASDTYPEFADLDVRTTFLQRLPHKGNSFRRLLPLYPLAFETLRLRGYDLVITSTSGWAHGTRVVGGTHVAFCHNPPRWLYQTDEYLSTAAGVSGHASAALSPALAVVRMWDRRAARRPDAYVAVSRSVAERIGAVYGREAQVIHSPVDVERIVSSPVSDPPEEPYFLVVARHLPYKRIDLAIEACQQRGSRLVVVGGDGPASAGLRDLAGPLVEFRQRLTDPELVVLLQGATALVQPGVEDFGLGPLEANAAGTPAVAFASGGALETVVAGRTGILFDAPSPDSLLTALGSVESGAWEAELLRAHAMTFGEPRFHRELLELVKALRTRP
jgi:glycosyltransferase involved in cell wall biosynthesis